MEGTRIYGTIPNLLKEQLDKRLFDGEYTISQALSLALHQWLNVPEVELYGSPGVLTPADLEAIRNLFATPGAFSHPLTQFIIEEEPEQKGIIMPDMTKTRVRPDPSIKHVSLFAHEIKPGDGVTNRLLAAGINPIDIVKAKRNRKAGRDWDQSLEPYFDLM